MEMARVANQILNEVKEMVKEMKVVAVMHSYPNVCIESPPSDLDCGDISEKRL